MKDHNESQASYAGTLMVFLLGLAVGATTAILCAPNSGEETRKQLADKAEDLKEKADGLKKQVADAAAHWKDVASTKMHRIGSSVNDNNIGVEVAEPVGSDA